MRFLRRRREAAPMSAIGVTDVGVVRSVNQDNFLTLLGRDAPLGGALLAVADGMGGHAAGEVASQMSLELLTDSLSSASSPSPQSLRQAVERANSGVYHASQRPDLRGMGTTLVAALLAGADLLLCNVGDSRAYLMRDGALNQLTQDHSWVGEMVASGHLTPQQAAVHPRRNVLTRALGVGESVQVDTTSVSLKRGDIVLICSDGLHGLVDDWMMAAILDRRAKSLKKIARELVESAKRAGGPDNITVVVARMDSHAQPLQTQSAVDRLGVTLPPC